MTSQEWEVRHRINSRLKIGEQAENKRTGPDWDNRRRLRVHAHKKRTIIEQENRPRKRRQYQRTSARISFLTSSSFSSQSYHLVLPSTSSASWLTTSTKKVNGCLNAQKMSKIQLWTELNGTESTTSFLLVWLFSESHSGSSKASTSSGKLQSGCGYHTFSFSSSTWQAFGWSTQFLTVIIALMLCLLVQTPSAGMISERRSTGGSALSQFLLSSACSDQGGPSIAFEFPCFTFWYIDIIFF